MPWPPSVRAWTGTCFGGASTDTEEARGGSATGRGRGRRKRAWPVGIDGQERREAFDEVLGESSAHQVCQLRVRTAGDDLESLTPFDPGYGAQLCHGRGVDVDLPGPSL